MQRKEVLEKLKALSNPKAVEGMARFGINPENTYGVSIPNLRKMAVIIVLPCCYPVRIYRSCFGGS